MYKTTDAGGSWSAIGVSGLSNWIWDIHWFDEQTGLATVPVSPGGIFRTTDGGNTWVNVCAVTCHDLAFSDPLHGGATVSDYTRPGTIETTDDGGLTWSTLYLPSPYAGSSLTALADGFFVGGYSSSILRLSRIVSAVPGSTSRDVSGWALSAHLLSAARFEISFRVPGDGPVDLAAFDLLGRRVATLADGDVKGASTIDRIWNATGSGGRPLPDGVYFLRLAAQGKARAIKVVVDR